MKIVMFEISDLIFQFLVGIAIVLVLGKIIPDVFKGSSLTQGNRNPANEQEFKALIRRREEWLRTQNLYKQNEVKKDESDKEHDGSSQG
jgi:hypothetical protein